MERTVAFGSAFSGLAVAGLCVATALGNRGELGSALWISYPYFVAALGLLVVPPALGLLRKREEARRSLDALLMGLAVASLVGVALDFWAGTGRAMVPFEIAVVLALGTSFAVNQVINRPAFREGFVEGGVSEDGAAGATPPEESDDVDDAHDAHEVNEEEDPADDEPDA